MVLMAQYELERLLELAEPVTAVLYPLLIVITFCNIGYKMFNFKPVKIPMLITLIVMTSWTTYDLLYAPQTQGVDTKESTVIPDASLGL
jgi:branched-subunit amino acid permease